MIVRPARPSDADEIAGILNPIIRDTAVTFNSVEKSADNVREEMAAAPCYQVLEAGGQVQGVASYVQFRRGIGYARAMEHTIAIAPDFKGQGAGRLLMATIEDHARQAGVGSLWAGVSGENPDGVKFHARVGFEEIAVLPKVGFKFGRWIDLVLMRKWLAAESV